MNEQIKELAREALLLHSFNYKSLDEAKKTVTVGDLFYSFDALSLCKYDHNLTPNEYQDLGKCFTNYYNTVSSEQNKERLERGILFQYLWGVGNPYRNYIIVKKHRPDFELIGDFRVGIEVTQLTTEIEKVVDRIAKDQFGQGKSAEEIRNNAIEKHGHKAENLTYDNFGKTQAIGVPVFNITDHKDLFVEQIKKKFDKYYDEIANFDSFCILADGQRAVALTSQYDVNDVYERLKRREPRIGQVKVAILWFDGQTGYVTEL